MRGRKPKPPELRLVEGKRGHRPIPETVKPRPVTPACPSSLPAEGKAEWKRVVPELAAMGLLTIVDRAALTGYCAAWAKFVRAEQEMTQRGVIGPWFSVWKEAMKEIRQFCVEFGMTPSSRSRMTVPGEKPIEDCPKCTLPRELCGCG